MKYNMKVIGINDDLISVKTDNTNLAEFGIGANKKDAKMKRLNFVEHKIRPCLKYTLLMLGLFSL